MNTIALLGRKEIRAHLVEEEIVLVRAQNVAHRRAHFVFGARQLAPARQGVRGAYVRALDIL